MGIKYNDRVTAKMEYIDLKFKYRTALADGRMVPDSPKHMASEELYRAAPGSVLHLCDGGYRYAVAVYSPQRNLDYAYTYAYEPEENWTSYTGNLTPETYQIGDYVFEADCWFRVCVRRADGGDLEEADRKRAGRLIRFTSEKPVYREKEYFRAEAARVAARIREAEQGAEAEPDTEAPIEPAEGREGGQTPQIMKLCLLADTHYTTGGTWEDTVHNIRAVAGMVRYDAVIHLGDLTDGMLSKELTAKYVRRMLADLDGCGIPVYVTPGNHDSNYFRNQDNAFTQEEMRRLYRLGGSGEQPGAETERTVMQRTATGAGAVSAKQGLDYYVDVPEHRVRMIFLSSFEDRAAIRYGYADSQLVWLEETLGTAAAGTRFLVFSHDAPLAKLDYWSFHIRNGERLLDILEECNRREAYQIAGFFYGHTHADYVFEECSFPVISVGCAKLEYFTDKKPQGAVAWPREAGTVTQDLWDSLAVDFDREMLTLIRFGAGEDRKVSFAKKASRYKDIMVRTRRERRMKIWAHRGASGHAPENTMAAFLLADTLGADGIELDVQLSKDGVPVVIHDERVDRVSDGTGFVRDMTLKELRSLNVNKSFPAYGRGRIPTLAEVYDWVRQTELTVNLELKNGLVHYEGLEEKVLRLAGEKGLEERILYSSFNHWSVLRLKKLQPAAQIAFLYSDGLLDMAEYGARYGARALHPPLSHMLSPASFGDGRKTDSDRSALVEDCCERSCGPVFVGQCHERGIRVHVWTVNEEADMERLREMGVDAAITNFVEKG